MGWTNLVLKGISELIFFTRYARFMKSLQNKFSEFLHLQNALRTLSQYRKKDSEKYTSTYLVSEHNNVRKKSILKKA